MLRWLEFCFKIEPRFHVELHFSPGVNCCVQKNLPPGPGFRTHHRNEKSVSQLLAGCHQLDGVDLIWNDLKWFELKQPTETVPPPTDNVPAACQTNCCRIDEEEDVIDAPESVTFPVDFKCAPTPVPFQVEKNTSARVPPNTFKLPLRPSEPITIRWITGRLFDFTSAILHYNSLIRWTYEFCDQLIESNRNSPARNPMDSPNLSFPPTSPSVTEPGLTVPCSASHTAPRSLRGGNSPNFDCQYTPRAKGMITDLFLLFFSSLHFLSLSLMSVPCSSS